MLRYIINNIFPKVCLGCEKIIPDSQLYLCSSCLNELSALKIPQNNNNFIFDRFHSRIPIKSVSSLFLFNKNSIIQRIIHSMKYENQPAIGDWIFSFWKEYNQNQSIKSLKIDAVIPVPVHRNRLKKRGYNQIEIYAQSIANYLSCDYRDDIIIRKQHLDSQISKDKNERLFRMENAFTINISETYNKGHYLIVDDVITTGTTMINCSKLLLCKNSSISIHSICITN